MRSKRPDSRPSWPTMLGALLLLALPAVPGAAAAESAAPESSSTTAAAAPSPVGSSSTCSYKVLAVSRVYREVPSAPAPLPCGPSPAGKASETAAPLRLGDVAVVCVPGLPALLEQLAQPACSAKKLVLYLNGHPLPDLTAFPPSDPATEALRFTLEPTSSSRDAWSALLGAPKWGTQNVSVSVGLADGFAFPGGRMLALETLAPGRVAAWSLVYGAILLGFFVLAAKSNLLRDAGPSPGGGARRPFSLARTQAAWWFFIILGSYLFIGIVTGDLLTSMTGTVLVLLGISSGTVVGGAAVDASRQTPANQAQQAAAVAQISATVTAASAQAAQADRAVQTAQAVALAAPAPAGADAVDGVAQAGNAAAVQQATAAAAVANADLAEKKAQLKAARNETESFFVDILSDADGVTFTRFQNAAWTFVLGIIFVVEVYRQLAMPQFDGSLLALMGISAGTYLGPKITEAKVPTPAP